MNIKDAPPPSTCSECKKLVPEVRYSYADSRIYCYKCYEIHKLNIEDSFVWKVGKAYSSKNTFRFSRSHAFVKNSTDNESICGKMNLNSHAFINIFEVEQKECEQCKKIIKKLKE